jgi:hypothetical protein
VTANLVLRGKVVSKDWCSFELSLTPASEKALKGKQGKFASPVKQDLLKLKPSLYCHGRELLKVNSEVTITVKISYFQYSSTPDFKNMTGTGMSVQPILIQLKTTKQ